MLRKKTMLVFIFLILSVLLAAGCGAGASAEKGKVIKIGKTQFDYERPFVEIARQVALENGYKVDVVEKDVESAFKSLARGDIDIWPGIRLPSLHNSYQDKYGKKYELGGTAFEKAPVGWVTSEFAEADCIAELKDDEESVDGKVFVPKSDSNMIEVPEQIIKGYDLDLEVVPVELSTLDSRLDRAFKENNFILFAGWRPDSMFRKYPLKFLDDPKGYWIQNSSFWGIREGFKQDAPGMYNFCQNFNMSVDDIENFLFGCREQDRSAKNLAKAWISKNRSEINDWAKVGAANKGVLSFFTRFFDTTPENDNWYNNGNDKNNSFNWPFYDGNDRGNDTPTDPGRDAQPGNEKAPPADDKEELKPGEDDKKASEQPEDQNKPGNAAGLSAMERQMFDLVNQERLKEGVPKYSVDSRLVKLARKKSRDMYENNYFSHNSPTYGGPYEMEKDAGINARVMGAENIARAMSVKKAHEMLMDSDGHRANILDSRHDAVGIGIVEASNGMLYITQLFIGN
ncbi:MAG: hypothetical protein K9L17_03680 [Clostridiales bacterium]|nr:hypothetical protein [Clostridiales bacterium]MCF8021778.1 hypothetical protein [Clostridiales bacterium]